MGNWGQILLHFNILSGKKLTGKFSVTETTPGLDSDSSKMDFGLLAQN
jgi:hypothetical protein